MPRTILACTVLLFAGIWAGGCTFYTDCPCADQGGGSSTPSGGSGGSSAGGGSSGSSGTGGEGGVFEPPEWTLATGDLGDRSAACGNITYLTTKPGEDMLIAGIAQGGLYASTDGGETWRGLGTDGMSEAVTNGPTGIVFDPEHPEVFWEAGIYTGGGIYKTSDSGETFERLGTIAHNDLVSIDFTDPDRQTLVAGGHEQSQVLYRSTDGGENWEMIGPNLPADCRHSTLPLVFDADNWLLGCVNGIVRTSDGGETWSSVSLAGGAGIPLWASDGSVYWAVEGNGGMVRSTDNGEQWTRITGGGLVTSVSPLELPDGRIATLSTSAVVVSDDAGTSWRSVSSQLPFMPAGLAYLPERKAFYIWHLSCEETIPEDAVMRADFDWETD